MNFKITSFHEFREKDKRFLKYLSEKVKGLFAGCLKKGCRASGGWKMQGHGLQGNFFNNRLDSILKFVYVV